MEYEYQMRLKDMNFNNNLKEIVEKYNIEIEELKISTIRTKEEKEKALIIQEDQWNNTKEKYHTELQVIINTNNKYIVK